MLRRHSRQVRAMDEHVGLPTIELSGSHREIGRQHGESARTQIRDSIAYYRESFKKITGLDWTDIKKNAPRWVAPIESYFPGITDEIRGIGEGAGVAFEEVLALNARGELSTHNPFADEAEEGCSSYALLPQASGDGHVYCGQNWDWRCETAGTVVLVRITQPGKPAIIMQTEAGQVGRHGANSAGIALNANGLGTRWGKGIGVPQPIIRRKILESADMQTALRAVFDSRQSLCTNLVLTHRDGFAIDLETTPDPHRSLPHTGRSRSTRFGACPASRRACAPRRTRRTRRACARPSPKRCAITSRTRTPFAS